MSWSYIVAKRITRLALRAGVTVVEARLRRLRRQGQRVPVEVELTRRPSHHGRESDDSETRHVQSQYPHACVIVLTTSSAVARKQSKLPLILHQSLDT